MSAADRVLSLFNPPRVGTLKPRRGERDVINGSPDDGSGELWWEVDGRWLNSVGSRGDISVSERLRACLKRFSGGEGLEWGRNES